MENIDLSIKGLEKGDKVDLEIIKGAVENKSAYSGFLRSCGSIISGRKTIQTRKKGITSIIQKRGSIFISSTRDTDFRRFLFRHLKTKLTMNRKSTKNSTLAGRLTQRQSATFTR